MSNTFYMPPMSLMGKGAIKGLGAELKSRDFKKALIVTDKVLVDIKLIEHLTNELSLNDIDYSIFDEVKPNPTEKNMEDGLAQLKVQSCDFVISFGGGSSHDCAKAMKLNTLSLISI